VSATRNSVCTLLIALSCIASCGSDTDAPPLTPAQLMDPENCKDCHPKHYEEWSTSMHAYASRDPVFIAMNKRGQEEAQLGKFCVQCHAPMAVRENAIADFSDLSAVPKQLQGVTCYFCHNAVNVKDPHNNANIDLANDTTMRAALGNPLKPTAHDVLTAKSTYHDPTSINSSILCGTCHDIMTPNGVHLERTLEEYLQSVQAKPSPASFQSCQDCHMRRNMAKEQAAPGYPGTIARTTHSHLWPAVDVALSNDMPNQDALRSAIESCEFQGNTFNVPMVAYGTNWLPGEPFSFTIQIDHLAAHNLPSGASADRRMWIEVEATDETGQVVLHSGKIADGELEEKPEGDPLYDPQFAPFRDRLTDAQGHEVHMFWEAAKYESDLMPFAIDPTIPHTAVRTFQTNRSMIKPPTRIEFWIRMRPMGMDVLQDLIDSGHLDPAVKATIPTYTLQHYEAILNFDKQRYEAHDLTTPDCATYAARFAQ
jgi:Cytochrome c554 and c-prime